MTAAIALAVVLVIAVAGASMAMESQRGAQAPGTRAAPRPTPPPRPPRPPSEPPKRPRLRERARPPEPVAETPPPATPEPDVKPPDLLTTGVAAEARVVSVVDERTIGPVTRSRLSLRIEPAGASPFEVTIRHAFQTHEARSKVKVGGTIAVRYDSEDHNRVVVDVSKD